MAKNNNLTDFMTDIADAIRAKKGTTNKINPQDFAAEIASIEGGGTNQRVSFIRRNGVGYIRTGIAGANDNLSIMIRYAMQTFPTGYLSIIHAYINESTNATRILLNKNTTVLGTLNSIASGSLSISRTGYEGIVYTDKLVPNGTTFKLIANGVSSTKSRTSGETLTDEITIFPETEDTSVMDLYQVTIKDGSEVVRNYIPHYQNGEFGLYDTITKQFYGNSGNGTFGGELITIE